MEFLKNALSDSLQKGFINHLNHSGNEYLPQLVLNDKEAGKKVLSTIDGGLRQCEEFWFSVAFVTTSGVATIINRLIELEKKKVKGKMLVSQYLNFSQPEALKQILKFQNIELKIATQGNFHSKGYLFLKGPINDLIIGSSNLTANALCENTEWNLKISATTESYIINNVIKEFTNEFEKAKPVTKEYITDYELIYKKQYDSYKAINTTLNRIEIVSPNDMQVEALASLQKLRAEGKRKALLISATGTGKTYLSAFDAKSINPKRILFVVHRLNIVKAAMKTFKVIFGESKSMGIYSGDTRELDKEFIFSTIQTISKAEHLKQFDKEHFDYIIIDETHRAGANSYQNILNYFNPKFLLGMTATPERTDGSDIFKLFEHTIAYEIRLHKAMEENMLSPFHYYGVTDIIVDGQELDEKADFLKLTSNERVEKIIETANLYGCDNGIVRGLIFCSEKSECIELSKEFNIRGFKTKALIDKSTELERADAITMLESDNENEKLDYIFTVDIFNEGVDIPSVNQVIMLRSTQSAIIFVQQLGRGLRKVAEKEYLTVIDFIGNYKNSYLIPIALYGDTSYNKDTLRKLMSDGSSIIPGSSTINFDEISQKRIFDSIDTAKMDRKKDLENDYKLLKYKLGRIPMMVDFVDHGSRDPQLYVNYSKSYFNFVATQETDLFSKLNASQKKYLEFVSMEIANAKRIEEVVILKLILNQNEIETGYLNSIIKDEYGINLSDATLESCLRNINFDFIRKPQKIIQRIGFKLIFESDFKELLNNNVFIHYLEDVLNYAEKKFKKQFSIDKYVDGFILYQKYSRKDVCRILNWEFNEESTVYGYKIKYNTCPIFVNYHKEDGIAATTNFPEKFNNNNEFLWFTKPNRNLTSKDVQTIKNYRNHLKFPFFVKKSNGEGSDFYYMGNVIPLEESFTQTTILNDNKKEVPVVKIMLSLNTPVEDSLYNYIINE
jgi:superfamily II DNA or RNA helicase